MRGSDKVSELFFLKRKNDGLFSYIFVYQEDHRNIVLIQLDAKTKPLATLNKCLVERITHEVLWKFLENFEIVSIVISFIRLLRRFSKINK